MTQVTPPGWYPDPGRKNDGPPTERWWDGKAWTDQVRPTGSAAEGTPPPEPPTEGAVPAYPVQPPADGTHPAYPVQPPADGTHPAYPVQPPADGAHPAYPVQPPADGAHPAYPVQPPADGAHPAYPVHPGYPGQVQSGGRRGLRTGIAVGVAAVVLASIGVGVYALTADGGSGGGAGSQQVPGGQGGQGGPGGGQGGPFGDSGGGNGGSGGGNGGSGGQSPSPEGSEAPKIDSGAVTDPVSGISIPIPDGWYGQQISWGAHVGSDKTYKCPSDTSQTCMKGGAYSTPALALGTKGETAEEIAKADISANADESYGKGYGEITSHEVLASKAVTVAGQKGYLVRWKAVTSKGADGYVESLAFPSPVSEKQMVVVRIGVDAGEQSVIDKITEGIKVSTGGGNGQDV
ncbi:DUF2510 domain-containing protein [Streptomyces sp. HD]|uniref:DUF2510 domain-containing protein n=1 Tax=Streptomyces sp. HD TaxID=3020892 RepID=UPI0023303007|nr:DUF2510 domain-containing protein [Streptomyces sp. HD]MDC0767058.1 DUF2510 domain-containing protein [Streptomyces sp. HD]